MAIGRLTDNSQRRGRASPRPAGGAEMADRDTPEQRYQDMTVAELRRRAREVGLAGRSSMRKKQLVRALRNHDGRRGGPSTDEAMTRSEEELRVGRRKAERGRARLRKTVETDRATATVPVEREELRVEREPITDANRDQAMQGPALSEAEHEVVLHEQRPVAHKEVVPKERVRLGTEKVKDQREVGRKLRKERIELEEDPTEPRR
jgi:uncharacterized protein (TIGR02271 family)